MTRLLSELRRAVTVGLIVAAPFILGVVVEWWKGQLK